MKIKIDYVITDFDGEDYDNAQYTKGIALNMASSLYAQLLAGIDVERGKIERAQEEAYWDRLIRFCHTGVMA